MNNWVYEEWMRACRKRALIPSSDDMHRMVHRAQSINPDYIENVGALRWQMHPVTTEAFEAEMTAGFHVIHIDIEGTSRRTFLGIEIEDCPQVPVGRVRLAYVIESGCDPH